MHEDLDYFYLNAVSITSKIDYEENKVYEDTFTGKLTKRISNCYNRYLSVDDSLLEVCNKLYIIIPSSNTTTKFTILHNYSLHHKVNKTQCHLELSMYYFVFISLHSHRTKTMTSHHQTDQDGVGIQSARPAGRHATAVTTIRLSSVSSPIGVRSYVRHTRQATMDLQHYLLYAYYATEDTTTEFSIATFRNVWYTFCIVHDGPSSIVLELIITKTVLRQYFVLVPSLSHCWNVSGSNRTGMLFDNTHSNKNLDANSDNILLHCTHWKFDSIDYVNVDNWSAGKLSCIQPLDYGP